MVYCEQVNFISADHQSVNSWKWTTRNNIVVVKSYNQRDFQFRKIPLLLSLDKNNLEWIEKCPKLPAELLVALRPIIFNQFNGSCIYLETMKINYAVSLPYHSSVVVQIHC